MDQEKSDLFLRSHKLFVNHAPEPDSQQKGRFIPVSLLHKVQTFACYLEQAHPTQQSQMSSLSFGNQEPITILK